MDESKNETAEIASNTVGAFVCYTKFLSSEGLLYL